ncbi:MAG: response regulator [Planctomycetes bacterium]|nr:response regulator [Planctomycetota bacterium]
MKFNKFLSIRTKLLLLALISATVAVAITGISMARKDTADLKEAKVERLSAQARMIAFNSTGVLTFLDNEAAENLLQSLEAEPTVELACLYDAESQLFASYAADGISEAPPTSPATCNSEYDSEGRLEVCEAIIDHENHLGTVVLRANSSDVAEKLQAGLFTILWVALFSLAVAVIFSGFLQRNISNPISKLSQTANAITQSGDYSLRVKIDSKDELGQLGNALNQMLSQVEETKSALTKAHDEMEERVLLRTAELSEEITQREKIQQDLEASIVAAETANRSKSEFLANMSHEIRTPLNGILGFTDLLIRDENATIEERRDFLETIQASGKHLLGLINDILDLSKIEAGQYDVEILTCQPHQIIAEVVSFLRVPAQEKGLELNCRWEGLAPATIQTDPGRFKQVLTNLVGNAVKFTEHGRVDIVAHVEDLEGNSQIVIGVVDTGIGIEQDKLDEIFSPFSQADNTVTRRFGGTGLGLTICRQIATALGGDVRVESSPGQGSTFTLSVPTGSLDEIERVDLSTADGIGRSHEETATQEFDLTGVEVLLVEDGSTNRKLISLALHRVGGNVTEAENGKIGSDLAMTGTFDVILMDMQMPVMDGYTATRLLREKNVTLPIVALTAHAMKGDQQKCLDAGCSGYLTKPVDIDQLIETVATATGRGEKSASSEATPSATTLTATKDDSANREPIYSSLPTEDEDFREIVCEFIPRMQASVEELSKAVHQSEWTKADELAHWLKGAGGTAGFSDFTQPTQRMCEQIGRDQYTSLESLLVEIQEISSLAAIRPTATEVPTSC